MSFALIGSNSVHSLYYNIPLLSSEVVSNNKVWFDLWVGDHREKQINACMLEYKYYFKYYRWEIVCFIKSRPQYEQAFIPLD